jgi:hypothetical protein
MAGLSMFDLLESVNLRFTSFGQDFTLQRTGESFHAVLIPQPSIDPRLDLGADPREFAIMEGRRDILPELKYGDIILQTSAVWFTEAGQTGSWPWKVVRRDDNPANVAIRYWMVKIGEFDEQ